MIGNGCGGDELTRDGEFPQAANGNLLSNGMSVMGYPGRNGVVNTNAPLTAINIPVGAGAGIESDYDDEHDGEPGFGDRRRYAVSRTGDGVRLAGRAALWPRLRRAWGDCEYMDLFGGLASGRLFGGPGECSPGGDHGNTYFDRRQSHYR